MATLSIVPTSQSQPEYLPPASEAQLYDKELRRAARGLRASHVLLAYYGARMRVNNLYSALGYESEDVYRSDLGIPPSTYYKHVRIGEMLYDLSLEDLQAISTGNAELLMKVDPVLMADHDWLLEAKNLSTDDFAALITKRNKQSGSGREPMVYFNCKMPYSAKKFVAESITAFQRKHNLASMSQALEFMVAERHDTPTILESLQSAQHLLKCAIKMFEVRGIEKMTEEFYLIRKARRLILEARQNTISATNEAAGIEDNEDGE